jgi:hypothetical protein
MVKQVKDLGLPLRAMEYGELGTDGTFFCSGYNAPIIFRNLQKMSLACRDCGFLQTRYPLWSTVSHHQKITLIRKPGMH